MARSLRIEAPGATYHITSRGNERRDVFQTDEDRQAFLAFLGTAVRRFRWSITAWVLMTNHFHLVIQTPQPNLSRGMQWFLGKYAGWYNARHQRVGHLFQGRFKSILLDKDNYFRNVLRYVVLNPVRANMVERPEDYQWSSYRCTAGLDDAFDWFVSQRLSSPHTRREACPRAGARRRCRPQRRTVPSVQWKTTRAVTIWHTTKRGNRVVPGAALTLQA